MLYNFASKIAFLFTAPEYWILALLVWIFLSRSRTVKKRLSAIVILMILFFGNGFIYISAVNAWQPKPVTLAGGVTLEAAIVLGGTASFDKYGHGYFNGSSDRFIEACLLYKTHKVKRIIISGGSNADDQPKDADFQYKKMLELGIPATDIIVEDSSRTTFENAALTKIKIDSLHLQPPFVLVTSAMHIPRAKRVFEKAGIPVIAFPCDYHILETKFSLADYIIPAPGTVLSWNLFLKEVIGIAGYKLFGKV